MTRIYTTMEVLVGFDYDEDEFDDEEAMLEQAAEDLSEICVKESLQAFTSPMIIFEDRHGVAAKVNIDIPDSLDVDDLRIE